MQGARLGFIVTALMLASACEAPPALPDALDGRWDVQRIAGASLGEDVRIEIEIDAAQGEMTGFTGCNRFTAPVSAFGETLAIGAVSEQDAPCASVAAATDETRFLMVLPSVARFARHGRALELLPREQGEALLRLRFADAQENSGD